MDQNISNTKEACNHVDTVHYLVDGRIQHSVQAMLDNAPVAHRTWSVLSEGTYVDHRSALSKSRPISYLCTALCVASLKSRGNIHSFVLFLRAVL